MDRPLQGSLKGQRISIGYDFFGSLPSDGMKDGLEEKWVEEEG